MIKTCYVFSHGWGFNKDFWKDLSTFFHPSDCIFNLENIFENTSTEYIGIGHSLGFIKLINLEIRFKKIIGIQGFINFLGFNAILRAKRTKELEVMIRNFEKAPDKTLRYFNKRCGLLPVDIDKKSLKNELNLLSRSFKLPAKTPILIIGAEDDPIVPPHLIRDNFKRTKNVEVIFNDKGLHSLGAKNCDFVYKKIMGFLNENEEKGNSATV